ncbi:TPA: hypothetical protein ACONKB_001229 [Staphylococcus aureus]|nr:hypothetical protein [Staphylococcus aureus]MDT3026826.1 hypothetical protein [Staphylococcus aureus]NKP33187.1 hypothetical protein [Staphylococcus aureus]NKP64322.1 hypothetical protein [Staphylococcus aureus]HCZ1444857.1 hypothetical protein [Staphylococcus aureus]
MLSNQRIEKEAACKHECFSKKLLTLNYKVDKIIKSSKTAAMFLKKNFKSVKLTIEITIKTI